MRPKAKTYLRIPDPEQRDRDTESQRDRGDRDTDDTDDTQGAASPTLRIGTVREAACAALADRSFGDPVFKFARAIRAFEKTMGMTIPADELGGTFAQWWTLAKSSLPSDTDFDECKLLFLDALTKVKTPLGTNVMDVAMRQVKSTALPREAERFTSPKIRKLIHLCYALQTIAGDSAFFLGVRDAARVIGCPRLETASAFLCGLVAEGILTVDQKGQPGGRRATRFRYNSTPVNPKPQ